MTCLFRCGNACTHPEPNRSDNEYFGDVVTSTLSRRGMLRAGTLSALVIGGAGALAADPQAASAAPAKGFGTSTARHGGNPPVRALTFKPIPPNTLDTVVVPNGYDNAVLLAWGDPILPGAPKFDIDRQSPAAQAGQFGFNNDWLVTLPLNRRGDRRLLVVNPEYTNEDLMFRDFTTMDAVTVDQIKIAIAAHGLSVVEIERVGDSGQWQAVTKGSRRYNRRITGATPMTFTGPAAGSALLRTAADPQGHTVLGSLNNCAGGLTPWGTVLSGEENFNQYFVGGDGTPTHAKPALARYGIDIVNRYPAGNRKWDRADSRFDLTVHPNEANRFGWIVEIDPVRRQVHPAQAHRAGPAQARRRRDHPGRRRQDRGVHGRRRALRLPVQVRVRQEDAPRELPLQQSPQHDLAGIRHAVRGEVLLHLRGGDRHGQAAHRRRLRRSRPVDPTRAWQHVAGARNERRAGPGPHPAGRSTRLSATD
jgi:uncharacterized protein